jgi:hypothetical protein
MANKRSARLAAGALVLIVLSLVLGGGALQRVGAVADSHSSRRNSAKLIVEVATNPPSSTAWSSSRSARSASFLVAKPPRSWRTRRPLASLPT